MRESKVFSEVCGFFVSGLVGMLVFGVYSFFFGQIFCDFSVEIFFGLWQDVFIYFQVVKIQLVLECLERYDFLMIYE